MKQSKKNPIKLRFENKELEQTTTSRNEEVVTLGRNLGKDQAISNTPPLTEERGIVFYRKLKNFCQQTLSEIRAVLQIDISKNEKKYLVLDEQEAILRKEIHQCEHEEILQKREVEKAEEAGKHKALRKNQRFVWVRLACVLFVSADFYFSAASLQKIGMGKFAAYVVATALAGAILTVAESIPFIIQRIDGKVKRAMAMLAIFTLFGILFYWIAYLRTTNADGTLSSSTPRIVFVGLNLFLLSVSTFLIWRYKPTKLEIADLDEYGTLKNGLTRLETKKKTLNEDLLSVIAERQELEDMERILRIYGSDLEEQVQDAYHTAYTEYCNSNLMHRSDNSNGQIPPFMESDPESLMFHFKNQ